MEALRHRTPLWTHKVALCLCAVLCATPGAKGGVSHAHSSLIASAPHQQYICPLGATVKLVCNQAGALLNSKDVLRDSWLFTPHIDQHCNNQHPRGHSGGDHNLPPGMHVHASKHNFWLTLENVTLADQGRYCCRFLEVDKGHGHQQVKQETHTHIVVTIKNQRDGSQNCTVWDSTPSGGGSLAVALAIAACILALLALPLILVLVYKQRHGGHSSRRGQELVRMDSEAQGHENPVFLGGSPQTKTRTVSQIMTRQSSEVGRHLLSEPGTPLSPPAHGDVFFPTEDTIPESPNVLQA